MLSIKNILIGIVFIVNLMGCATVTKGTSQSITINTKPIGALCTLSREGENIAIVNPTPGNVTVEKDKDNISVLCEKDGYQETPDILSSKVQGMTFGNILLGGVIGAAVDAGSGAMHQYQSMLTITLIPEKFASFEERDEFFNKMKTDYVLEYEKVIERINSKCSNFHDMTSGEYNNPQAQDSCDEPLRAAEEKKKIKLAEIEEKRSQSVISN